MAKMTLKELQITGKVNYNQLIADFGE